MDPGSISAIVASAWRVSLRLGQFAYAAQDANETIGDLFSKLDNLRGICDAIHQSLEKRARQNDTRPLDPDEEGIWIQVRSALRQCQQTMDLFEEKLQGIGGRAERGRFKRAVLQLRLEVKGPVIERLGRKVDANIGSLNVLLPFLKPPRDEETQTSLREIHETIKGVEARFKELSRQQQASSVNQDQDPQQEINNPRTTRALDELRNKDGLEDETPDLRTMRESIQTARSLADKMSLHGSVGRRRSLGTTTPCDADHAREWRDRLSGEDDGYSSAAIESDSDEEETDSGGVSLPVPWVTNREVPHRAAATPGRAGGRDRSSATFGSNQPPEVMATLIDKFKENANKEFTAGDYRSAESHLLDAIGHAEKREAIYGFPFDEKSELQQQLAEAQVKQHKFQEAKEIYLALLQEAREDSDSLGELYYSLADLYRMRYRVERDDALFEDFEKYAQQAFNLALEEPPRLLSRPAEILVELYEFKKQPVYVETYKAYLEPSLGEPQHLPPTLPSIRLSADSRRTPSESSSDFLASTAISSVNATALTSAIDSGDFYQVEEQLRLGADIEQTCDQGKTPLMHAVDRKDRRTIQSLKERGVQINAINSKGMTALHYAVETGSMEMTELLLELGAAIELIGVNGRTPLLHAAKQRETEIVRLLLSKKADVHSKSSQSWTVLHHAIFGIDNDNPDLLRALLEYQVDVDSPASDGSSPLHYAVLCDKAKSAEMLLGSDANVNAQDNAQRTALWLAVKGNKYEMVELLLAKGATSEGKTLPETSKGIKELLDNSSPSAGGSKSDLTSSTRLGSRQSDSNAASRRASGSRMISKLWSSKPKPRAMT